LIVYFIKNISNFLSATRHTRYFNIWLLPFIGFNKLLGESVGWA